MEITWYGQSCFRISERGRVSIITDPYDETLGLPMLKTKAEVVTISHDAPGHNAAHMIKGVEHIVARPGEYEIGDVFITGIPLHDASEQPVRANTGFLFTYDQLTVLHLGDLSHVPSQSFVQNLVQEVNVLLAPIGGGNGLKAAQAAEVVALFEPNFVIPMHYALPGLNLALEGVDKFIKAMGVSKAIESDSLKVTTSDLPEQTQVVLLNPQIA